MPAQGGNLGQSWQIDCAHPIVEISYFPHYSWQRRVGWSTNPLRPLIELDCIPLQADQRQLFQLPHLAHPLRRLVAELHRYTCPNCGELVEQAGPEAFLRQIDKLRLKTGVLCLALVIDGESSQARADRAALFDQHYLLVDYKLQRSDLGAANNKHLAVVLATIELSNAKLDHSEIRRTLERLPHTALDLFQISDRSKPAQHVGRLSAGDRCLKCGCEVTPIDLSDLNLVLNHYKHQSDQMITQLFSAPFNSLSKLVQQESKGADLGRSDLFEFVRCAVELGLERLNLTRSFSSLSTGERLKFSLATILTAPLYDALIVSRLWDYLCDRRYDREIATRLESRGCNFVIFKSLRSPAQKLDLATSKPAPFENQEALQFFNIRLPNVSISEFKIEVGSVNLIVGSSGSGKSALLNQVIARFEDANLSPALFECTANKGAFRQILKANERAALRQATIADLAGLTKLPPKSARRDEATTLLMQLGFELSDFARPAILVSDSAIQRLLLAYSLTTSSDRRGARRGIAKRGRLVLLDDPGLGCGESILSAIQTAIAALIQLGDTVVVSDTIGFLESKTNFHEIRLQSC